MTLFRSPAPVIAVINKIDRCDKDALFPLIAELNESGRFAEIIPVSALKKDNLERLKNLIFQHLPEGEPRYDPETLTNLTDRQTASEIVREKLLDLTRQEIPHATHTRTETWEELEDGRLKIGVAIWVDRDSQKGIIIGKGGSMLRAIGEAARKELNDMLGRRIHLELFVTVKPEWRDKPSALKELGLG